MCRGRVGDADAKALERVFNRSVAMTPLASSSALQLDGVCKSLAKATVMKR
jgi:hypothetical protein